VILILIHVPTKPHILDPHVMVLICRVIMNMPLINNVLHLLMPFILNKRIAGIILVSPNSH